MICRKQINIWIVGRYELRFLKKGEGTALQPLTLTDKPPMDRPTDRIRAFVVNGGSKWLIL